MVCCDVRDSSLVNQLYLPRLHMCVETGKGRKIIVPGLLATFLCVYGIMLAD